MAGTRSSPTPPMPRYKPVDRSPRLLPVVLADQIQPGTFEFALDHLVDHELDLSALDAKFRNDEVGAGVYNPRVMMRCLGAQSSVPAVDLAEHGISMERQAAVGHGGVTMV